MTVQAHYTRGTEHCSVTGLEAIREVLRNVEATVWIEADEDSDELGRFLQEDLQIHHLTVEDIFQRQTTPKSEEADDYLYIVMHGVHRDKQDVSELGLVEIDLILGRTWLFTHHPQSMRSVESVREELSRTQKLLKQGPAFVAHAIVDRLTEHYAPVTDAFDDEVDELSRSALEDSGPHLLEELYALRRSLQRLRRISVYQRDVLHRLSRDQFALIPDGTRPFFRDAYDHFVRIADHTDSNRELINGAMELYLSVSSNRTNDIMKVLAIISTLMLPLTFVAGVYGMNFEHMPELHWRWGYPFALILMVVIVAVLLAYFRKRKWI